jgi:DegV family protein with EDD domain
VGRIAVVTDSASDLSPERAAAKGIVVVPLIVSFGSETFRAGTELSTPDFWRRMLAPEAPFPTTAACSPGDFQTVYERCFAEGAEAIISIHVASTLSATIRSATLAREMLPDRDIHVVDSMSASMAQGLLAELAVELAAAGRPTAEVVGVLRERIKDIQVMLVLDTLAYLRKGGRISGAQATMGTLLSVEPIIEVRNGLVETVERVRTKSKARQRMIELLCIRPMEKLVILHTVTQDVEAYRDEFVQHVPGGIDPASVSVELVGPSVGPHLGPGCVGAVVLYARRAAERGPG